MRPLRLSVDVQKADTSVNLICPAWALSVDEIGVNRDLRQYLINDKDSPVADFLSTQFLYDFGDLSTAEAVPSTDLVMLCRACVNEWFGVLYDHPWWEVLAHSADTDRFREWVLQNYGLSKLAAKSSAIAAGAGSSNREFFIDSIIEEYEHHSTFFRSIASDLLIDENFYGNETSLGIRALETHLCGLARTDELALILFYYFQECSAYLVDDFREYYVHIEQLYGIEGFFSGWLGHVDIDDELDHGGEVERVLKLFGGVHPAKLRTSLENAWLGVVLLLSDYDRMAAVHVEAKVVPFTDLDIARQAIEGLSKAEDSDAIVSLGTLLERHYTGASQSTDRGRWAETVYCLVGKMLAAGDLSRVDIGADLRPQNKTLTLLKSLLVRKPPDLFSGGPYYLPSL